MTHQVLNESRLAGADAAGDDDEPGLLQQAIFEQAVRDPMVAAEIQEFRIRKDGKRAFSQAVEAFVHLNGSSAGATWFSSTAMTSAHRGMGFGFSRPSANCSEPSRSSLPTPSFPLLSPNRPH